MGDSLLPNQPLPLDAQGNFIPSSSLSNFDPPKALDDFYESTRATKLPRLATDVLEIIRDLFWSKEAHGGKPWKRFNLLGHGMGGAVAQTMSLVIMDGSPFANQAFISEFDPNDAKREGLGLEHLVLLGSSARASNQFGGGVFEALAKGDMGQVGDLFSHGPEKEAVISIFRTGRRPRVIIGSFSRSRRAPRSMLTLFEFARPTTVSFRFPVLQQLNSLPRPLSQKNNSSP